MHTHHTHPKRAEPRKRNIPKVSIRHRDAGISPLSQKESCHQEKKSDERLNKAPSRPPSGAVKTPNSTSFQTPNLQHATALLLRIAIGISSLKVQFAVDRTSR